MERAAVGVGARSTGSRARAAAPVYLGAAQPFAAARSKAAAAAVRFNRAAWSPCRPFPWAYVATGASAQCWGGGKI